MILFYFLIGVMPLSQHRIWGQSIGGFTVFKYLGAACVLYALVRLVARRTLPPYFRSWQARFLVVFYLIAATSYFTKSVPNSLEFSPFFSYTSFLLLFFITVTLVDSLRDLRWVLLVAIGSVAFASLYVIREWQKYHSLETGFRPGWVVGDPNYFTISAVLTLPIAFYLMLARRRSEERVFCLGCLVVTLVAVTLGASRGGFLGLVAAFLFAVWHSRRRLRNLVLAGALILPLSLISPISPLERLLHPSPADKGAEDSRTTVWKAGLRMIRAHPITGVGLGNFKSRVARYEPVGTTVDNVAHNAYIEIAAEMGLPALLVFLAILYFSYQTLHRVCLRASIAGLPLIFQAASGLQAGLVGGAVAIFFVSGQYQKLLWFTIFVAMCLPPLMTAAGRSRLTGSRQLSRQH